MNAIHSEPSRVTYGYHLKGLLKFCNFDRYEQLLEISDNEKFEAIKEYVSHRIVGKDKVSYSTIKITIAAIKLFYEINGVEHIPNWKQITKLKGKPRRVVDDELYTDEQIKLLLEHADLTEKVAVLTLLSTGMRVGALAGLRYKDVTPVIFKDLKFYKFMPYGDDLNERYVTFCTPECVSMIDIYFKHRTEKEGEKLIEDSPFIRHKTNSIHGIKMKGFYSSKGLQKMLERLRYDANIESKTVVESGRHAESGRIRKRTMRAHVFRKMFNTFCNNNDVNMNHTIKEKLMGHKKGQGLDYNYDRSGDNVLLQEYLKVVDLLTVDDANRLQKENTDLKKEVEDIDLLKKMMKEKDQELKFQVQSLQEQLLTIEEKFNLAEEYGQRARTLNREVESLDFQKDRKKKSQKFDEYLEARSKQIKQQNELYRTLEKKYKKIKK
jgi:integrase